LTSFRVLIISFIHTASSRVLSICYPVKFLNNNFSVNVMWLYECVCVDGCSITKKNNHKQRI